MEEFALEMLCEIVAEMGFSDTMTFVKMYELSTGVRVDIFRYSNYNQVREIIMSVLMSRGLTLENCESLLQYIKTSGSAISGSFILKCLLNDDMDFGDIDIYTKDHEGMITAISTLIDKDFDIRQIEDRYGNIPCRVTKAYDEPSKIGNVYDLTFNERHYDLKIQIIKLDGCRDIVDIVEYIKRNYDLEFCKCVFDGESIIHFNPEAVGQKRCDISQNVIPSGRINRLIKYTRRGFKIDGIAEYIWRYLSPDAIRETELHPKYGTYNSNAVCRVMHYMAHALKGCIRNRRSTKRDHLWNFVKRDYRRLTMMDLSYCFKYLTFHMYDHPAFCDKLTELSHDLINGCDASVKVREWCIFMFDNLNIEFYEKGSLEEIRVIENVVSISAEILEFDKTFKRCFGMKKEDIYDMCGWRANNCVCHNIGYCLAHEVLKHVDAGTMRRLNFDAPRMITYRLLGSQDERNKYLFEYIEEGFREVFGIGYIGRKIHYEL